MGYKRVATTNKSHAHPSGPGGGAEPGGDPGLVVDPGPLGWAGDLLVIATRL